MEETQVERKIMKVRKDHTSDDATAVIARAVKVIMPQTINFYWRKMCAYVMQSFRAIMIEPVKES